MTDDSNDFGEVSPAVVPILATRAVVIPDQSGFTLLFQQPVITMGANDSGQVKQETFAAIVLSPIVAKSFMNVLMRTIGQFEDWIGAEIPDAPSTPTPSGPVTGMTRN